MSTRTSRRYVATTVALLALVGASGCTHESAEPAPLPSESSSATAAATPSEAASASGSPAAAPSMPAGAKGTSAKSAEAFVRYWIEVLDYSGPAGTTTQLRRSFGAGCVDCDAIADAIDSVHRSGGHISGRGWTVLKLRSTKTRSRKLIVNATVQVQPQSVVTKRGAKPQKFSGGKRAKVFVLVRTGGEWNVASLDQSSG